MIQFFFSSFFFFDLIVCVPLEYNSKLIQWYQKRKRFPLAHQQVEWDLKWGTKYMFSLTRKYLLLPDHENNRNQESPFCVKAQEAYYRPQRILSFGTPWEGTWNRSLGYPWKVTGVPPEGTWDHSLGYPPPAKDMGPVGKFEYSCQMVFIPFE